MKFKFLACALACIMTLGCASACVQYAPKERKDTSYLYIKVNEGGYGSQYMKDVAAKFSEKFAEEQDYFAEGKKGVIVTVNEANITSLDSIANDNVYQLYVTEGVHYTSTFTSGKTSLYDLSDIVDDTLEDGKTIANKLYAEQKDYLTGVDGNYYALPMFAGFTGVTIDKEAVWDVDTKLLFADEGGQNILGVDYVSPYTGKPYSTYARFPVGNSGETTLSPGPDGQYDTSDDGFPSSYEEFFYFLDCIVKAGMQPFVFYDGHYTSYLYQSLLSYNSTKNELLSNFTFNSGNEEIKYVSDWNGEEPVVSSGKVTLENGYITTRQYNKYLALKFLKVLYGNPTYFKRAVNPATLTNTGAQKIFIDSKQNAQLGLGTKTRIAMIIEGNYWYNEAASNLKDNNANRDFMFMPLPAIETGSVEEGSGKAPAISDCLEFYVQANNNIKKDAEKEKLVKEFIKFFYTESSLQLATKTLGLPFGVKYQMDNTDNMSPYAKSLWSIYKKAMDADGYVTPMSTNKVFANNITRFSIKTTKGFPGSPKIGETQPYYAFSKSSPRTVKEYLNGMEITEAEWNTSYNK